MRKRMQRVPKPKKLAEVIQFRTAEEVAKEELFSYLKDFIYNPDVKNVMLIVNYGNINAIGTFATTPTTPIEAVGILELAKNCFRG